MLRYEWVALLGVGLGALGCSPADPVGGGGGSPGDPRCTGLTSLVYGNGRFVRFTWRDFNVHHTEVDVSDDQGATWRAAPDIPGTELLPVFGNGVFLATPTNDPTGRGGFRSTDGLHWEPASLGDLGRVAFGAGLFVRAHGGGLSTSSDALHWTERSDAARFTAGIGFVNFSDGQFVASNLEAVLMSPDGIAWQQVPGAGVPFPDLSDAIPFRGGLVATRFSKADGHQSWAAGFSPDFKRWESGPHGNFGAYLRFGAEVFAGHQDGPFEDGAVASTSDGVTWTAGPTFEAAPPTLAMSETTLVAATSCAIKTSTDGKTWIPRAAR
jgi:hypothetical protein